MKYLGWLILGTGLTALVTAGNSTDGSCGPTNGWGVCTKKSHCCRYGYCGNGGEYCAQGCNPLYSYDAASCYPLPVCQSKTYTFGRKGNARLAKKANYKKVDPLNIDFIIDTGELKNTPDGVILTLKKDKIGAKITSTRALHYGKITFEIQTAWSGGVVTAAVLMGDTSEEVDLEFTGNALKVVQSNIFYDYKPFGGSHALDADSSRSFANYSLDWTKDKVAWGYSKNSQERILRTVTPKQKRIPELPMYAQMSIWPGGASKASGTRGWAGGLIDWTGARFKQSGEEFRLIVKSVTIECYDDFAKNQAYKYIRNKKTKNKLSFDVIKLKGYGVSKKPIPALTLQSASMQGSGAVLGEEELASNEGILPAEQQAPVEGRNGTNELATGTGPAIRARRIAKDGKDPDSKPTGTESGSSWTTKWTSSWTKSSSSWTSTETRRQSSWTTSWREEG